MGEFVMHGLKKPFVHILDIFGIKPVCHVKSYLEPAFGRTERNRSVSIPCSRPHYMQNGRSMFSHKVYTCHLHIGFQPNMLYDFRKPHALQKICRCQILGEVRFNIFQTIFIINIVSFHIVRSQPFVKFTFRFRGSVENALGTVQILFIA